MPWLVAISVFFTGAALPVRIDLKDIGKNPATAGSQLMTTAALLKSDIPRDLKFHYRGATLFCQRDVTQILCVVPLENANENLNQVIAGLAPDDRRGATLGALILHNLRPPEVKDPEDLHTFLWKNDTVRKMALGIWRVRRAERGDLRLQLWGKPDRPLVEIPMEPLAKVAPAPSFLTAQVVEQRLILRFRGEYQASLDLCFDPYRF